MRITTCGASGGEVTGSSYLVETPNARILIDCGLFQGNGQADDAANRDLGPINPASLDAVVLTHAHLDHCGRLPLLAAKGLNCPIYATPATIDFTTVVLEDSLKIQESDTQRENNYRRREGRPLIAPFFTREDAARLPPLARPLAYDQPRQILPGVTLTFADAGHILGSASAHIKIAQGGERRDLLFSGDIGRWETPFLADPQLPVAPADIIFLESTYGDKDHASEEQTSVAFETILRQAIEDRRKVLIPAFAIGRAQHVLYYLAAITRSGALPQFPIFLDSPMAIRATQLYQKHKHLFDEESRAHAAKRGFSHDLRNLHYASSVEESRQINDVEGACVIIAGGGMCEGGRIVHHLRHNISKHNTTVIMVGYASPGTLGRRLIERAPTVEIHRRTLPVRATIHSLGGFSAHAGQTELVRWVAPAISPSSRIFLVHGENPQRTALAQLLSEQFNANVSLPRQYQAFDI